MTADDRTDDQLDGLACWYCGAIRPRVSYPVGWAPRPPSYRCEGVSQVFACSDCYDRGGAR